VPAAKALISASLDAAALEAAGAPRPHRSRSPMKRSTQNSGRKSLRCWCVVPATAAERAKENGRGKIRQATINGVRPSLRA
jgi:hypothetical protein